MRKGRPVADLDREAYDAVGIFDRLHELVGFCRRRNLPREADAAATALRDLLDASIFEGTPGSKLREWAFDTLSRCLHDPQLIENFWPWLLARMEQLTNESEGMGSFTVLLVDFIDDVEIANLPREEWRAYYWFFQVYENPKLRWLYDWVSDSTIDPQMLARNLQWH